MNKIDNKNNKNIIYVVVIMLFVVLCLPLVIVVFMWYIPSPLQKVGNAEWLAFWATYGGNIIGLLGLSVVTWFQYKYQNQQFEKQLVEQNNFLFKQNDLDNDRINRELKYNTLKENNEFLKIKTLELVATIKILEFNYGVVVKDSLDNVTDKVLNISDGINKGLLISDKLNPDDNVKDIKDRLHTIRYLLFELKDSIEDPDINVVDTIQRIINATSNMERYMDLHISEQTLYYIDLINRK